MCSDQRWRRARRKWRGQSPCWRMRRRPAGGPTSKTMPRKNRKSGSANKTKHESCRRSQRRKGRDPRSPSYLGASGNSGLVSRPCLCTSDSSYIIVNCGYKSTDSIFQCSSFNSSAPRDTWAELQPGGHALPPTRTSTLLLGYMRGVPFEAHPCRTR